MANETIELMVFFDVPDPSIAVVDKSCGLYGHLCCCFERKIAKESWKQNRIQSTKMATSPVTVFVLLFVVSGMICKASGRSIHRRSIEISSSKAWVYDEDYSLDESKNFENGDFHLGIPKNHSCIEIEFSVPHGRLICSKNKINNRVMCYAQCKKGRFLNGGYIRDKNDKNIQLTSFGVYRCNPGNNGHWTDNNDIKLALPSPFCSQFDTF